MGLPSARVLVDRSARSLRSPNQAHVYFAMKPEIVYATFCPADLKHKPLVSLEVFGTARNIFTPKAFTLRRVASA